MAIDPIIKQKAGKIRNEKLGRDVRESLASGLENMSEDVVETIGRQLKLDSQFQTVIDETTGKDIISAPEIIAARNGKTDLSGRLNDDYDELENKITTNHSGLTSSIDTINSNIDTINSNVNTVDSKIDTKVDALEDALAEIQDYIIEQGENQRGWWEKWASGKLVQYGSYLTTHYGVTEQWGSIYVSEPVTIVYPIPFWDMYTLDVNPISDSGAAGWVTQYGSGQTNRLTESPSYSLARPTSNSSTINAQYDFIAIGRWKEPDYW